MVVEEDEGDASPEASARSSRRRAPRPLATHLSVSFARRASRSFAERTPRRVLARKVSFGRSRVLGRWRYARTPCLSTPSARARASRITRDARYSSWRALAAEYPPDMSRWSARVDLPASRRPVTRAGQGGGGTTGHPPRLRIISLRLLQILAPRITATSAISVIRADEPANRRTRWRPPRRPSHGSLALTSSAEDAVDHRVLVASPSPPPAPPRWNPPRPTTRSSSSSSATAS